MIKVSFIEFLNAVPLGWGFLRGCCRGEVELLSDVPAECSRRLATGEADVGLIPVIECQRIPGLTVLPGIAIAAKREARSVLFVSKTRIEDVRMVALDSSSRTSVALLEILLQRFYGKSDVQFRVEKPDPSSLLRDCDAALVIGNPALQVARTGLYVYDLAGEWNRFTGLPFVFAVWAVRPGLSLHRQAHLFYRSREEGLDAIDEISRVYSGKLGIPPEEISSYLLTNLDYSLDPANRCGLELFFSYAAELGLIDQVRPLEFQSVCPEGAGMESFSDG